MLGRTYDDGTDVPCWTNSELKTLLNKRKRLFKIVKKAKKQKDQSRLMALNLKIKHTLKQNYNNYLSDLIEENDANNNKTF